MAQPRTYGELALDVEAQGSIAEYAMGVLRDLDGAGKLGTHVRRRISEQLGLHDLGHIPEDLPVYQEQLVRVFSRRSTVGRVVEAVLHPSAAGDSILRAIGSDEAYQKVEQIQQILAS